MAIRFNNNAANYLSRGANLPNYNGEYTWMAWLRFTDTGWSNLCHIETDGTNFDVLELNDTGIQFFLERQVAGASTSSSSANHNENQWYHVAMVGTAADLKLYVDGALVLTEVRAVGARGAAVGMACGGLVGGGDPLDGRLACMKFWDGDALSADEIKQEMWTIRPNLTASGYAWWPCFPGAAERDQDYGDNGYDWTQNGALTDEDPPPVGWTAKPYTLFVAAVPPPVFIPRHPAAYNTLAIY